MSLQEMEQKSQKLIYEIRQINDINEELIMQIEEILPQYSKYYKDYSIDNPGQFISNNQATLFMAYTKVFTVPVLITNGKKAFANASGLLLNLDRKFLVTNFHVYEKWKKLNDESTTYFQIGSVSIPVEDSIIDINRTLDLITISVPEFLLEMLSISSYKKFYTPENWSIETEKGTMVVASGYPGKIRDDHMGFSALHHGSIIDEITDITESKYIMPFNRDEWKQVLGIKDIKDLTSLGGFSGGPVFSFDHGVVNLVGIIFEDGGDFFDGIRIIRKSMINTDGTINNQWGY
ncbi:hypothetical protein MKZ20_21960 [Psychrobacillus sp. FSL K6-2684]|uniref:hypothetical protein n=1 Tax=unclassified Psychrobacillus TaxID=2636677 RepID=UPI0030F7E5F7